MGTNAKLALAVIALIEWQVARRYMSPESLARARVRVIDGEREEVMPELMAAG